MLNPGFPREKENSTAVLATTETTGFNTEEKFRSILTKCFKENKTGSCFHQELRFSSKVMHRNISKYLALNKNKFQIEKEIGPSLFYPCPHGAPEKTLLLRRSCFLIKKILDGFRLTHSKTNSHPHTLWPDTF